MTSQNSSQFSSQNVSIELPPREATSAIRHCNATKTRMGSALHWPLEFLWWVIDRLTSLDGRGFAQQKVLRQCGSSHRHEIGWSALRKLQKKIRTTRVQMICRKIRRLCFVIRIAHRGQTQSKKRDLSSYWVETKVYRWKPTTLISHGLSPPCNQTTRSTLTCG